MATEIKSARDALEKIEKLAHCDLCNVYPKYRAKFDAKIGGIERIAKAALALPVRKGKWKNGTKYEYEYAYCSECGRMQWAGWDTHKQAEENIESFAHDYKFCPGCGAEMEGGVYVK